MSSIHSYGEWDELPVTGRSALTLTLVSKVPATVAATGTTTTPKYLGAARGRRRPGQAGHYPGTHREP